MANENHDGMINDNLLEKLSTNGDLNDVHKTVSDPVVEGSQKNNIVMSQNPNKLYEVFLTQDFKVDIGELDTSDPRIRKYVPHFTNHCFVNDEVRDPNTDELLGACVGKWVYGKDEEEAAEKARLHILLDIYHMYVANELTRVERRDKKSPSFLYKQLLRELEYT